MEILNVSNYFDELFLTPGATRSKFVINNCSEKFLTYAKRRLSIPRSSCKPINITLTKNDELALENILSMFDDEQHKTLIAEDYLNTRIMIKVLDDLGIKEQEGVLSRANLQCGLQKFARGEKEDVKVFHYVCPHYVDVDQAMNNGTSAELNFFMNGCKNKYLQQGINTYISLKEPYGIKVFTTDNCLSTYSATNGKQIDSPYDYISVDIRQYVETREIPDRRK